MIGITILNIVLWPIIHFAVSKLAFKIKLEHFNPCSFLFRSRNFEDQGKFYEKALKIKKWKSRLPDGARIMGEGFSLKNLKSYNPEYLRIFFGESCRSEWAHWVTLSFAPLFFIWNPLWASAVMVAYALVANLPCIVVQRYNRHRIQRIFRRQ